MKSVCVFCGSSPGKDRAYMDAAETLGKTLAAQNLTLVYGGASVGLMGRVADSCLENGGLVVGVIPDKLVKMKLAHKNLSELHVVGSMHERKSLMAELADGFIALPGGFGTIEEFFEVLTWSQLGFHNKPCGLLNINGYYEKLTEFLDHAVEQEFVAPCNRQTIIMDCNPENLLQQMTDFKPAPTDKADWIIQKTKSFKHVE